MCGISGIYTIDGNDLEKIREMTDVIFHRGPDGFGFWNSPDNKVSLGHRRLSIIDLSQEAGQPMQYSERFVITFNGEIYNYLEIKEELLRLGMAFRTQSDTEVLLASYQAWGKDLLNKVDGMFAFAIYDKERKELFCARDRFGEKPFYYCYEEGKFFVFGSEIKQLLKWQKSKALNTRMLYNYFENCYSINNPQDEHETFYEGISKLPKANYLIISDAIVLSEYHYWDIDLNKQINLSYEDAVSEFRHLFLRSLKYRMRSDVPIGSSLSGGLDSSSIVCSLARLLEPPLKKQTVFSARFQNFDKDEGKFITFVNKSVNVEAFNVWISEEQFASEIGDVIYFQDEPFPTASIYAQYKVMQEAKRQGIIVLLDGQGADETLAGYEYYLDTYLHEVRVKNPEQFQSIQRQIGDLYPKFAPSHEKKSSLWKRAERKILDRIRAAKYRFGDENTREKYGLSMLQTKELLVKYKHDNSAYTLNEHLLYSVKKDNLEDLLRFCDRNSMANSREVRLPFLCKDLVEFLFALPSSYKMHGGWTKSILRDAMHGIIPIEIERRKDKIGYEPPQAKWMRSNRTIELIQDAFSDLQHQQILGKDARTFGLDWQVLNVSILLKNVSV